MTKLLFSVRITEKYFSAAQIESLEQELSSFNSKSEFMRKIIKFYLKHNNSDFKLEEKAPTTIELKDLLEKNNVLLQQLLKNKPQVPNNKTQATVTYRGKKQENKTNQALSLLDQF